MKSPSIWMLMVAAAMFVTGCTQETKEKTDEAAKAVGEAAASAAEDAKENVEKAASATKEGVENAVDAVKEKVGDGSETPPN